MVVHGRFTNDEFHAHLAGIPDLALAGEGDDEIAARRERFEEEAKAAKRNARLGRALLRSGSGRTIEALGSFADNERGGGRFTFFKGKQTRVGQWMHDVNKARRDSAEPRFLDRAPRRAALHCHGDGPDPHSC